MSFDVICMRNECTNRDLRTLATFAGAIVFVCALTARMECQKGHAAPPRPPAASKLAPIQRHENPGGAAHGNAPRGEHLAEWMNQHNNLTATEQQQALEREPGFHELPSQTQQRMRDRLTQLNAMSPDQRQRVLERNEHMEQLTPEQRGQVRGAMQQLGALPQDQRREVARSFRELRQLPPDQRAAAMNSSRYSNLNESQRATLNGLMRVEPMLPAPEKQ
jgi:hypothetical protein